VLRSASSTLSTGAVLGTSGSVAAKFSGSGVTEPLLLRIRLQRDGFFYRVLRSESWDSMLLRWTTRRSRCSSSCRRVRSTDGRALLLKAVCRQ
jgi:hypothetical protein